MKKEVIVFTFLYIFLFFSVASISSKEISTLATVEVKPAYDLAIDINILNSKLLSGENLSVFIELKKTNLTNLIGKISVDLNYEISKNGKKGEIIESGFLKTVNITNLKTEVVDVSFSSNLKGKHILKITASNPQSNSDEDSETFTVRKRKGRHSFSSIFFSLFKKRTK